MSEFYYYVWGLYGIAALGMFYLGWRVIRRIRVSAISHALLALLIAVMFTPAKTLPDQADLTPAIMMAIFDGIAFGWSGVWNGLKYILLVYLALLAILLVAHLIKNAVRPKREAGAENETTPARE